MCRIRPAIQCSLLVFVLGVLSLPAAAQYDATPLISWHPDGSMLAVTDVEGVTILNGDTLETLNEIPGTVDGMAPIALVKAANSGRLLRCVWMKWSFMAGRPVHKIVTFIVTGKKSGKLHRVCRDAIGERSSHGVRFKFFRSMPRPHQK